MQTVIAIPIHKPSPRPRAAAPTGSQVVDLWSRPGFLIRRLHQLSVAIFLDEMGEVDLTPIQFGALAIVARYPGIEQSALGEELGIDRVNASDVISRLVKNDLVNREPSRQDRRYRNIFLTTAGEDVLARARERMQTVQDRFLAPLGVPEQEAFMRLVLKLILGNNEHGRSPLRVPVET